MITDIPQPKLKPLRKELIKQGFENLIIVSNNNELYPLRRNDNCIALIESDLDTTQIKSFFLDIPYLGTPIELLKKGEVLRIGNTKRVYTLEGYCRLNKAYEVGANDDISYARYLKKGKLVKTDFDY